MQPVYFCLVLFIAYDCKTSFQLEKHGLFSQGFLIHVICVLIFLITYHYACKLSLL